MNDIALLDNPVSERPLDPDKKVEVTAGREGLGRADRSGVRAQSAAKWGVFGG